MAGPIAGVCDVWATEADLCSPCNDYDNLGPIAADMLQAASDILYELSGRQFPGVCSRTVRPMPPCHHREVCGCWESYRTELGAYPIVDVSQVKVDGVVLDPSRYRVDDFRTLVRQPDADGTNPGWPRSQRLDLEDSEADTWSVSFTWGREPPPMGVRAAAVLACELALSCDPENAEQCRLPKNVTSVTREGVSIVMSPSDFLDKEGKTGLYEVDLFLRAVNPERVRRRAAVWWPGRQSNVRAGTD